MSILRDVKETVLDGQLGFSGSSGYGVSIRIGVSPISSDKLITISGDMTADTTGHANAQRNDRRYKYYYLAIG